MQPHLLLKTLHQIQSDVGGTLDPSIITEEGFKMQEAKLVEEQCHTWF
jgi:hypothetical protein